MPVFDPGLSRKGRLKSKIRNRPLSTNTPTSPLNEGCPTFRLNLGLIGPG